MPHQTGVAFLLGGFAFSRLPCLFNRVFPVRIPAPGKRSGETSGFSAGRSE